MSSNQEGVTMILHDEKWREFQSAAVLQPKHVAGIRPVISSPDGDECGCVRTDDGECGCLRDMTEENASNSPA